MTRHDDAQVPAEHVHDLRARAESFGSIAGEYDRHRPPYPDALVVEIASRGGVEVLDVGCGTGKASVLLAERGLQVLGVEVDPAMAAVARAHGIPVEVGSFEEWDDLGRHFDIITAAQSWHWVDPVAGAAKAARLLRPGGSLALFWNVHHLDNSVRARMDDIYTAHAPSLTETRRGGVRGRTDMYRESLDAAGFVDLATRAFPWEHVYDRADFVALLGTYSDHHLLPDDERAGLLAAIGALVDDLGGTIAVHYEGHLIFARTPTVSA